MKIISVIPFKKGIPKSDLTYFTSLEVATGNIVTVSIKSKKILALVTSVEELKDKKSNVKGMNFNLKKVIENKGDSIFLKEFLEAVFDTNKYFVICVNVLGGCKGSTGPASINPKTGKPYALNFPVITVNDMVETQRVLIREHLGIKKILCMAGGSMGGLQALQWAVAYPDEVASVIAIAANARQTAQQIALHEVGRQAIMKDPDWKSGDYYGKSVPANGLSVARMLGHVTYMSDKSMEEKFGRKLFDKEKFGYDFSNEFEVENYLKYRSDNFVQRFDANSYLYISKALDYFDLAPDGDLAKAFRNIKASFLVISFTSDWLYPAYQAKEMVKALKTNDLDVSYCEVQSNYGHDAFLVEIAGQAHLIEHYLARIQREINQK